MKKIIALALALVMMLGLVACGGTGGNAGSDAATRSPSSGMTRPTCICPPSALSWTRL